MSKEGVVVVTDASSGIGEAGHPSLLLAHRLDRWEALKRPNTLYEKVDVTDRDQIKSAVEKVVTKFDAVDRLVNSAGVMLVGPADSPDPKEWEQMVQVNIMGVLSGIHVILVGMKERRQGTIINVSSVAGYKTYPNHVKYCVTKFDVHAFTEHIRQEAAVYDVRLITIGPGTVQTELFSHMRHRTKWVNRFKAKMWQAQFYLPINSRSVFAFKKSYSVRLDRIHRRFLFLRRCYVSFISLPDDSK